MYEFERTGGGQYGLVNTSWPFTKLKVTNNKLELNISLIGNLVFRPADVVSIVPLSRGVFTNSIRINHTVKGYYKTVMFRSFIDSDQLLKQISQTGFMDNKETLPAYEDMAITNMQSRGGFAIKTSAAIAIIVAWNVLYLPDFLGLFENDGKINPLHFFGGAKLALGFVIALCAALIVSDPVRNLVLKEGRTFNDVKVFVYCVMLITTIMLISHIIIPLPSPR